MVIEPIGGGPSEKVGVVAGDRIVEIDGEKVAGVGISTTGVRSRLMGMKGTKVNIRVFRMGMKEMLDFTIILILYGIMFYVIEKYFDIKGL